MDRAEKIEFVFGSILLLANKMQIWGDKILEDLTLKQWFLLMMITKMGNKPPTLNEVSDFTGTSRQNVKTMLKQLEVKKYVKVKKSKSDARALNVTLLKKTFDFFSENEEKCTIAIDDLFSKVTDEELAFTLKMFDKLHVFFGNPTIDEIYREEKEV